MNLLNGLSNTLSPAPAFPRPSMPIGLRFHLSTSAQIVQRPPRRLSDKVLRPLTVGETHHSSQACPLDTYGCSHKKCTKRQGKLNRLSNQLCSFNWLQPENILQQVNCISHTQVSPAPPFSVHAIQRALASFRFHL